MIPGKGKYLLYNTNTSKVIYAISASNWQHIDEEYQTGYKKTN
jgi:hypothetical protein